MPSSRRLGKQMCFQHIAKVWYIFSNCFGLFFVMIVSNFKWLMQFIQLDVISITPDLVICAWHNINTFQNSRSETIWYFPIWTDYNNIQDLEKFGINMSLMVLSYWGLFDCKGSCSSIHDLSTITVPIVFPGIYNICLIWKVWI